MIPHRPNDMPISRFSPVFALFVAAAVLSPLSVAGCGWDNITENEARHGFRAASKPLQKGQQTIQKKVQAQLAKENGRVALFHKLKTKGITHRVDCTDSGDVKFAMSVSSLDENSEEEGDFT
ncbi:MAG: hypothetical protein ABEN55_07630, partial [Bradymonadaceae bacterium]